MKTQHNPPRWAQRFLQWYCKPQLLEDLEGDLQEYFDRNCKTKGVLRARLIYIVDVLKFFRSYTLRKPGFLDLIIHWIMIGSYVKTSARSIVRNKLFSSINIIGLAISMSVGLLMIAMLMDALSFDKFHENHDRIYRVISQYQYRGNKDGDFHATTSLKAATLIRESFPGIEDAAIFYSGMDKDVTFNEKTIPLHGFWANEAVFSVFSFHLIQGNPETALVQPFSIVLTEKSALKLFNNTDVVGKTVNLDGDREYTVTGVMADIPFFSHIKFDMLASLSTMTITEKDSDKEMSWSRMWFTYTYILLPEHADPQTIQAKLDALSLREAKTSKDIHIQLDLQPLDEIVTGDNLSNQTGPVIGKFAIWILSALTLVVIISACFNYTNLSIARSLRRSREVGIRKTIGAMKSHVVFQFITESIIIALIALVFAFIMFLFIRPHFIALEPGLQQLLVLNLTPALIGFFIVFAIFVGICAGLFPALSFGKTNALQVLKNISTIPGLKGWTLRKTLIVFQYTVSIIAITATAVFYRQYIHFVTYDLGFTTENIVNISLQGNKPELFKKELEELHEVKGISLSSMITGTGFITSTMMINPNDPMDSSAVFFAMVDENYLPLHDHQLIAGRNFDPKPEQADETEVIVNEQLLRRFNINGKDPKNAINQVIKLNGKEVRIIGVVKDFEYGRANNRISKEAIFRYSNQEVHHLNLKILSEDWPTTYERLQSVWKKIDPVHPFEARFYSEQIEEAFAGLKATMKLGGFLAFLVIVIASIGLLGMVVFTTEVRLKEVSIRKVMGASERGLLFLLSKGFFLLLFIAAGIAVPLTYLFFDKILLPNIANHAPLQVLEMFIGVAVIMIIALIMICSQTLKAARTNPSQVLKSE